METPQANGLVGHQANGARLALVLDDAEEKVLESCTLQVQISGTSSGTTAIARDQPSGPRGICKTSRTLQERLSFRMQVAALDFEIPPEASTFPPLIYLMDASSSDTSSLHLQAGDTS